MQTVCGWCCGDVIGARKHRGFASPRQGKANSSSKKDVMKTNPPAAASRTDWSSVELGPELPLSVFASTERWHEERIRALALYCSDGRWGEAFDEFCQNHLLIPRYDRWAVPGGPAWLVPRDEQLSFFTAAREQVDFLVKVHELEQIVLITHFGCAYYHQRCQKSPEESLPIQVEDVRTAANTLRGWYPSMRVDAYLAMRRGNCLSFHSLDQQVNVIPPHGNAPSAHATTKPVQGKSRKQG
jgi:hypothetical protein